MILVWELEPGALAGQGGIPVLWSISTASSSLDFWDAPRPVLLCGIIASVNSRVGSALLTSAPQSPGL